MWDKFIIFMAEAIKQRDYVYDLLKRNEVAQVGKESF